MGARNRTLPTTSVQFKVAYPYDHNRAGEVHAHVIVINTAVLFHRTPETEEWRVLLHETAHYGGFTHETRDGNPFTAYDAEDCFKRDKTKERGLSGGGGFRWQAESGDNSYGNINANLSCSIVELDMSSCKTMYLSIDPPPDNDDDIWWNGRWWFFNGSQWEATVCHDFKVWVEICN